MASRGREHLNINCHTAVSPPGQVRVIVIILLLFTSNSAVIRAQAASADCLILYDSSGEYGWIGQLHGQMLANLLGHFPLSFKLERVEDYAAGEIDSVKNVFYIGTVYDNPLPGDLLLDVINTTNPVCWLHYNLWQLSGSSSLGAQFRNKFGFRFGALDSSGYSNITYNGEVFSKDMLEPELGRVVILNSNIAQAAAIAWNPNPSNAIPYLVHGSNFWYVADVPFSYISEEDRYLVFADLLHDIVQIQHPPSHRALLRLEDIDPTYPPNLLREAADFLASEGVPFTVAVVPVYADPLGVYNGGLAERIPMSEAPAFIETLQYLASRGGQILMHGYTHQYSSVVNPFTGVTGDDYEFFRVTVDAATNLVDYFPVPEDSRSWAQARLQAGLAEFQQAGLTPVAWETPHYAASALDYSVFAGTFSLTFQRVLYFDSQGHSAGQFFPYPIEKDVYGQKIMPENLGNIDPLSWNGYPPRLPADLIRAARKNRVLRDAWAGAYFHPWLELDYLRDLVQGIKALGYTYVPLVNTNPPVFLRQPENRTVQPGDPASFSVQAAGADPLQYQWQLNGTNLPAGTNAALLLANTQPAQAGFYAVLVSNSAGGLTSLPAALQVISPFALSNWLTANGAFNIAFQGQLGIVYLVEFCANFPAPSWQPLTNVVGTGSICEVQDSPVANRFYRVRVE